MIITKTKVGLTLKVGVLAQDNLELFFSSKFEEFKLAHRNLILRLARTTTEREFFEKPKSYIGYVLRLLQAFLKKE